MPGDKLLQRVRELRHGAQEKIADWLAHLVARIIRMRCQLQGRWFGICICILTGRFPMDERRDR